jgi:hypothetical protein
MKIGMLEWQQRELDAILRGVGGAELLRRRGRTGWNPTESKWIKVVLSIFGGADGVTGDVTPKGGGGCGVTGVPRSDPSKSR